ncbi:hypothetical protein [Breznakiella homolactica]|uniref:Uncharacterized protein n=1 Tax=Breznakiella homolactica TaxID=2798577 RepID=A0A7T8BAU9_9SPIR|nr:hypothetical protein [Breznakiella homolactica]QQO11119.1 hypothetical protein JFL75_09440 [Breznakiella homolactica]
MQYPLTLTEYMNQYTRGFINRKQLEDNIFRFILENARRFNVPRWNQEDYTDYLCWLYPRICRAIENYTDRGSSFDAYIGSLIRWSAREYRSKEADHSALEQAYWNARTMDMVTLNEEPAYPEIQIPFKTVPNPRQVLILLLKCYYFVSDDFIERVAPAIKVDKIILKKLIEKLRQIRAVRDGEIMGLRERIFNQYYRCISFEERMKAAPEGSAHRENMRDRLQKGRKRLASMRKRLAGMRTEPSNRQVAEVLGVPKGTVDSNLYALKEKWKHSRD